MKIAFLADQTGNGFYRGIAPMSALEQTRGHQVRRLAHHADPPPLHGVRDVDVLFIHRFCDEDALRLAREAKAHGAAVVWDNDDDINAVPRSSVAYRRHGGIHTERRRGEMRKLFALTDAVTAPSEVLAARLSAAGAPAVSVLENHIPTEFLRPDRRPHTAITIGWVAGFEHQMDVDRLPIKAALQQLLDERPEVSVMSVGLGLGLRSERYRLDKEVQLVVLTQHLAQWDIGIAPIADIDFNRARSNIKLKEYAAAGIPWLASPIGPYEGMGEKQGGRLVADDDWHAQLTQLIDKPRDRRKLAKRAEKWVSGQTLERHVDAWEAVLEGALRRRGATSSG